MIYNAGERKDVRKAEKAARLVEKQRHEVIFGLMTLIAGRQWMLEKLEECHVFATSFARDAITMAYMEGERSIGLRLLNDIMASCPDQYIQMMRERNERNAARSRSAAAESTGSQDGNGRDKGRDDTYDYPSDLEPDTPAGADD